jgi:cobalamin biosynthesis Mg chelatase CobN
VPAKKFKEFIMALPILAAQAAIGVLRLAATKGVQEAVKKHGRELYNAAIATAKEAGKKGDQVRQSLNRLATKSSDSAKKLPAPIKQIISKETARATNRAKLPKPIRDSLIKRGESAPSSKIKVDPAERITKPATSTASRSGRGATAAKTVAGVTAAGTAASTSNQQSSPAISIRGGTDADVARVKRKTAEANKKVGTGSSGPSTRQSNRTTKAATPKSTEKNYNVGVSKGGVSFNQAFRHFRNSGAKEFTWNGKKYTTKLKEEK